MRRILTLLGERGGGDKVVRHRGCTLHHMGICYERFVRYRDDCETSLIVNRRLLHSAVRMIGRSAAVMTEDPDALILQFMMERIGMRPKPFIIILIDCLRRAKNAAAWLVATYGEDRFARFVTNPMNEFLYTTRAQRDIYVDSGVPPERLHYLPTSVWLFETLFPTARAPFRAVGTRTLPPRLRWAAGAVLCPGSNNRDYQTLVQALGNGDLPVHVVPDLHYDMALSRVNIQWHGFLPMPEYAKVMRNAKVVVIPTKPGNRQAGGGQATTTMAMRLGRPIVASADPSTQEYITHGQTGLLVEPGKPKELRSAVEHLFGNATEARRLGENAKRAEAELSSHARRVFDGVLDSLNS